MPNPTPPSKPPHHSAFCSSKPERGTLPRRIVQLYEALDYSAKSKLAGLARQTLAGCKNRYSNELSPKEISALARAIHVCGIRLHSEDQYEFLKIVGANFSGLTGRKTSSIIYMLGCIEISWLDIESLESFRKGYFQHLVKHVNVPASTDPFNGLCVRQLVASLWTFSELDAYWFNFPEDYRTSCLLAVLKCAERFNDRDVPSVFWALSNLKVPWTHLAPIEQRALKKAIARTLFKLNIQHLEHVLLGLKKMGYPDKDRPRDDGMYSCVRRNLKLIVTKRSNIKYSQAPEVVSVFHLLSTLKSFKIEDTPPQEQVDMLMPLLLEHEIEFNFEEWSKIIEGLSEFGIKFDTCQSPELSALLHSFFMYTSEHIDTAKPSELVTIFYAMKKIGFLKSSTFKGLGLEQKLQICELLAELRKLVLLDREEKGIVANCLSQISANNCSSDFFKLRREMRNYQASTRKHCSEETDPHEHEMDEEHLLRIAIDSITKFVM